MIEQENPQKNKCYKQEPNDHTKNENCEVWNKEYFIEWIQQQTRDERPKIQWTLKLMNKRIQY